MDVRVPTRKVTIVSKAVGLSQSNNVSLCGFQYRSMAERVTDYNAKYGSAHFLTFD
jgi:hypothetical protein